jgi:glycosyltransferase involved in cell wall biosynthesis
MNASPLVISVVVPAYNAAAFIAKSLASVVGQQGPFETEVIVVDDGSTDDTRELVRSFGDVRLIAQANAGPSAARNRGIAAARGDYVAFLDSDDIWPEGKLAAQVEVAQRHPEAGLIFGDCRIFTDEGPRAQTFFEEAGLDGGFWGHSTLVHDAYRKLFKTNFVPTGAAMVRRDCFDEVGMFDEQRRYVEDMELWFRLAFRFPVAYTTHLCELKRETGAGLSANAERMALAFIDVLELQILSHGDLIREKRIPVAQRIAYEYCLLGDRSERDGRLPEARRYYLRGFQRYPSLRSAFYWMRSFVHRLPPIEG